MFYMFTGDAPRPVAMLKQGGRLPRRSVSILRQPRLTFGVRSQAADLPSVW
jgi:hypothetical protein